MHKSDLAAGGVFAAVAAVFLVGAVKLGIASPTSDGVPGPGFFPFLLSSLLIVLCGVMAAQYLTHKGEKHESFRRDVEQKGNMKPFVLTLAALLVMFAIWHLWCFEAGCLFFCLAANQIYKRSWKFTIAFSVIFTAMIHILFIRLLMLSFEL